jgi:hypothetical protein
MLSIAPVAAAFGQAGRQRAVAKYGWPDERARLAGWLFGDAVGG